MMVYVMVTDDKVLAVDGESVWNRHGMLEIEDNYHAVVATFNQNAIIGCWIDKYKVQPIAQS